MSSITSSWRELPLGRGVEVIVRDAQGVGALAKPAGVLSMPNRPGEEERALVRARYDLEGEFFEWENDGATRRLWLLNRLDSATSGVILAADTQRAADAVKRHFKERQVEKRYRALVFGRPQRPEEAWRDRLAVEKREGRIRTGAGPIPAESEMRLLRTRAAGNGLPALSLIELAPKTGRSHQLRVQCAKRRLPIVGDRTYGDFAANRAFAKATGRRRLMLHSLSTRFAYDWDGRKVEFAAEAPLPPEFEIG